jgi:uncharacterized protein
VAKQDNFASNEDTIAAAAGQRSDNYKDICVKRDLCNGRDRRETMTTPTTAAAPNGVDELVTRSPLDAASAMTPVRLRRAPRKSWRPSRFNARSVAEDGAIVLWNTYSRAISVFKPRHRPALDALLSQHGFEGDLTGIARYLYDRGYIVEADADEMQRFRLLFGMQHYRTDRLELILLASEDCNFRCRYCYEEFARGTMQPTVRAGVKALVSARAPRLQSMYISWFGGEPLYGYDAIADLAPELLRIARDRDIAYAGQMTTNGYLLTPDVAEQLLAWEIRAFQITLDGLAETHDRSRVRRDGAPTFGTIIENLRALQRRPDDFRVRLRVNYDRSNYGTLREFLDYLEPDFANDPRFEFTPYAVGRWGGANDEQLDVCGKDEMRNVRDAVRGYARAKGFHVGNGIKDINLPGAQVCYAARPYSLIIGAVGQVMKCTVALDKDDRNVVGHLREDGHLDLDEAKLAQWTAPAFETDQQCQSCYLVPSCQGMACPLVRIESGQRTCCGTKSNLRSEMLDAYRSDRADSRTVLIATGATEARQSAIAG